MNATQAGMRRAETEVIQHIRDVKAKTGVRWKPPIGLTPMQWWKAIERLEARRCIRYVRSRQWVHSRYEEIKR